MTKLLYLQNPSATEACVQIMSLGDDDRGRYLILDNTLFYPQGGGQPADQGQIDVNAQSYQIKDVRNIDGEIRHYIAAVELTSVLNCEAKISIDQKRRKVNTRYHTAGHLVAAIAEQLTPDVKAMKGHQFPGEAYVEFDGMLANIDEFRERMQSTINGQLKKNNRVKTEDLLPEDARRVLIDTPYELPKDKSLRICHIEGFTPVPCGGTHVTYLEEVGKIKIIKCKSKKGKSKIFYELDNYGN